jgi:hypothetical protein
VPLEEMLCSCRSDLLQNIIKEVSLLTGGVLLCVDHPWWDTTWLGRYVQLSGHDLLFPEWISTNPLPYCFVSGFSPQTFRASWQSPVFNTPEFLIPRNV